MSVEGAVRFFTPLMFFFLSPNRSWHFIFLIVENLLHQLFKYKQWASAMEKIRWTTMLLKCTADIEALVYVERETEIAPRKHHTVMIAFAWSHNRPIKSLYQCLCGDDDFCYGCPNLSHYCWVHFIPTIYRYIFLILFSACHLQEVGFWNWLRVQNSSGGSQWSWQVHTPEATWWNTDTYWWAYTKA